LAKSSKAFVDEFFTFCTAMQHDRAISKGLTHSELWMDAQIRQLAVGPRYKQLHVTFDTVDWSQCGPWHLARSDGDGLLYAVHRYLEAQASSIKKSNQINKSKQIKINESNKVK
jgi:hypothetical protein